MMVLIGFINDSVQNRGYKIYESVHICTIAHNSSNLHYMKKVNHRRLLAHVYMLARVYFNQQGRGVFVQGCVHFAESTQKKGTFQHTHILCSKT